MKTIVALFLKDIWEEWQKMSIKMKLLQGIVLALLLTCILLTATACSSFDPGTSYVTANYKFSQNALPDFIDYIKEDDSLSDLDKETRIQAVEQWKKLLEQKYNNMQKKE